MLMNRQVQIAYKTLNAIEDAIKADGGAAYRGWLGRVIPHMSDAYREEKEEHRGHLGASILGGECARAIWYAFHWSVKGQFDGRMLRLFNRGHLEEARFIAMLLTIGVAVYQQDENGKQYRISFGDGHGGGSGDGIGFQIPDINPGTGAILEFKTHGEKSFIELAGDLKEYRLHIQDPKKNQFTGKGVRVAKFEHFVQFQIYMRRMGYSCALYCAVNKNTDDLYMEVIHLEPDFADQYISRGENIIPMLAPPEKLNPSPGFWKCRFCDYHAVCHLKAMPDKNCRTCRYSVTGPAGQWFCTNREQDPSGGCPLPKDVQLIGCRHYEANLVFGQ